MICRRPSLPTAASGSVLLVAMVVLLLLGLLAAGITRTASLQLRMAGHDMAGTRADHAAQAMLDALAPAVAEFPVARPVAYRRCNPAASCDDNSLAWPVPPGNLGPADWRWQIALERLAPHRDDSLPLHLTEDRVSSDVAFDAVRVEAQVNLQTDSGLLEAQVRRGWALLAPASGGGALP